MKMKILMIVSIVAITAVFVSGPVLSQDKEKVEWETGHWYPKLDVGFTFTQSTYSDNWNGDEEGQIVWAFMLNSSLGRQLHERVKWTNTLKLAYGHTHKQAIGVTGERTWERPEKSTDLIDLETLFLFEVGKWVSPYASGQALSKFEDGSDPYGRSIWINPVTLKEGVGVAREFYRYEDRYFVTRAGIAGRHNIRRVFAGAPPQDGTITNVGTDAGFEWVTDYKSKAMQGIVWTSKLTVYKPLMYSFKSDYDGFTDAGLDTLGLDRNLSDYPTAVDIDWENIFTAQVNKWLSVNLYVQFIYDKYDNSVTPELDNDGNLLNPGAVNAAVRKAGQFKETLAVGITYRFL